jgi:ATP synthase F1 complex assembly factor 2
MPDLKTGHLVQKFYKQAGVLASPKGFQVTLDSRPVHTPERQVLLLPSQALALAVAAEWEQQEKFLNPHTMPLMQMSTRAVDMTITKLKESLLNRIVNYLASDTVCIRDSTPELQAQQEASFSPVLAHIKATYNLDLPTVTSVQLLDLPTSTLTNLLEHCESLDLFDLVALETAAAVSKSAALALALQDGFIGITEGLRLSRMEEDFQHQLSGKVQAHDVEEAQSLMMLAAARAMAVLKRAV